MTQGFVDFGTVFRSYYEMPYKFVARFEERLVFAVSARDGGG